ncbi:MAG: IclR family transcriptional regulator [Candidatus Nanopelagicales bacterium]
MTGVATRHAGDAQIAQTLDRGLQILELLASSAEELSTTEIAAAVDVHRTVAHRLLVTLERRDLVDRSRTGRYRLSAGVLRLGAGVRDNLREVSLPFLAELNEATDETVHLAVLRGADVQFLESIESSRQLRVVSRVGRSMPAHATSVGKAILAALSADDLHSVLAATALEPVGPATVTDLGALQRELTAIRRRGYAVSKQESEAGVGSVGVSVVDRRGHVRAAISVAAPLSRLSDYEIKRMAKWAQLTAKQIGANV